jgi:hypothetical protein
MLNNVERQAMGCPGRLSVEVASSMHPRRELRARGFASRSRRGGPDPTGGLAVEGVA